MVTDIIVPKSIASYMINCRSEWGILYLPDEGPYFHNTKQDAIYGAT